MLLFFLGFMTVIFINICFAVYHKTEENKKLFKEAQDLQVKMDKINKQQEIIILLEDAFKKGSVSQTVIDEKEIVITDTSITDTPFSKLGVAVDEKQKVKTSREKNIEEYIVYLKFARDKFASEEEKTVLDNIINRIK